MKIFRSLAIIFSICCFSHVSAEPLGIQVIVDSELIDSDYTEEFLRETVERWILETNSYFENSNSGLELELVNLEFRPISTPGTRPNADVIFENIAFTRNGFEGVYNTAEALGADYTIGVTRTLFHNEPEGEVELCGKAVRINLSLERALIMLYRYRDHVRYRGSTYAALALYCDSGTFAHEIGHLMGLAHGDGVARCENDSNHSTAVTGYAKGFTNSNCDSVYDSGEFKTMMVHNYVVGRLYPGFSNPDITDEICKNGACGDADIANAARVLRDNVHNYISYEGIDADRLTFSDASLQTCISDTQFNHEIFEVTAINCQSRKISDLTGIEQLNAAAYVNLGYNSINVVSPLELLDVNRIKSIDLTGNQEAICRQLDSLEKTFPGKVVRPSSCLNLGALIASVGLALN